MSRYLARLKAKNRQDPIPYELPKLPKGGFDSFGSYPGRGFSRNDGPPGPDEDEIEERKGMAAGSVLEPYLDAFARLQCQKLITVLDDEQRQAINDAGRFLDAWGALAAEFQWSPGDLFDVPRDGKPGGLVWFLKGEAVRALGHAHATTESARKFLREKDFDAGLLGEGVIR
jgi:hypothetical protein